MTQAQVAEATDLSLEMVGRLERGVTAPSFESIAALAAALQVPVPALFGAEPGETEGERGQTLSRIRALLARFPDPDLRRVERVLGALLTD